jgi:hypothetical protein
MTDRKKATKTAKINAEIKNKDCFFIVTNIIVMVIKFKIVLIKYQWDLL